MQRGLVSGKARNRTQDGVNGFDRGLPRILYWQSSGLKIHIVLPMKERNKKYIQRMNLRDGNKAVGSAHFGNPPKEILVSSH